MARTTAMRRLIETLADATGRSEEEVRLALASLALVVTLIAGLRLLEYLSELGADVGPHAHQVRPGPPHVALST